MKYHGYVGYGKTVETDPGVFKDEITEIECFGDLVRNSKRTAPSEGTTNDNVVLSNRISILANPYALTNFHNIRYATYMGVKWTVDSVDIEFPRMFLTLGGEYNG